MVSFTARVSAINESSVVDFGWRFGVARGVTLGSWMSRKHQLGEVVEAKAARDCSDNGPLRIAGRSKMAILRGISRGLGSDMFYRVTR